MKNFCACLFCFIAGTVYAGDFAFEEKENVLRLLDGGKPVWEYAIDLAAHSDVPIDDPRRLAGCYLHPIWGVNGETLTDNAPKDHYHHHGAFWTWPHVLLHNADGSTEEYDLWTGVPSSSAKSAYNPAPSGEEANKPQNRPMNALIRQRAVQILRREATDDSAILEVENGWYIGESATGAAPKEADRVMSERVTITTGPIRESNGVRSRAIDLSFVWTPLDRAISLRGAEEKSYGGLTVRFRPKNAPRQSDFITTPEGTAADDMPEKHLPWADYTSRFGNSGIFSGMAVFVPASHPDYPPTWLVRYYGAICVGWPGVNAKSFPPQEEIRLRYRLWIHEEKLTAEQIEKEYSEWAKSESD